MQHTVIAFFDAYPQAEAARDALVAQGLARESIALQTRCEPTYATDATTVSDTPPTADSILASIERFFESLFTSVPLTHETAHYAEAVRRGAVMLSVDAPTEEQCEAAKSALERMNPIDIEERAATWCAPGDKAMREHSPLDELGIRRGTRPRQAGAVHTYARDATMQPPATTGMSNSTPTAASEAEATALAAGAAPRMGAAVPAPRRVAPVAGGAAYVEEPKATTTAFIPDEYLQEEEHFKGNKVADGP